MTRRQRSLAVLTAVTLAVSLACVPLIGKAGGDAGPGVGDEAADCWPAHLAPYPDKPQLDCPAPPNTFNVSAFFSSDSSVDEKLAAGPTFDAWAWSTFAAMNWPAKQESGDPATYPTGYARGVPDLSASFAAAADDDVLVWETFKEKRELFQPTDTPAAAQVNATSRWQAVTFDPGQEPMSGGNMDGNEPCAGVHAERAAALHRQRGHHR
ncbi:MAG TPA: hypothetical protein VKU40_08395, partial [Thermoanaerobaculia bacterium]|nr:hypothetical protein [Thermoanaerobaculia bacterium]